MAIGDFLESETVVAAGATATALSPRVRRWVRQGAVYGVAGVMTVADTAFGVGRGAARRVPFVGGPESDGAGRSSRAQTPSQARGSTS